MKEEFDFWVNTVVQCFTTDIEAQKLSELGKKITDKKAEIKNAKKHKKSNIDDLSNELNQLKDLYKAQEKKVEHLQEHRLLGVLNIFTNKAGNYMSAIQEIVEKGSAACVTLNELSAGLLLGGGLLVLAKSLNDVFKNIDQIHDYSENIATLDAFHREFLESDHGFSLLAASLISNMLSLKIEHLIRSGEIAKSKAAFATLNALSSSVAAGQLGIALAAVLTSAVIATPGLNVAASVIAIATTVGIKAKKLHHLLKTDKEGLKLDVQIREKAAQVYASAGRFYADAARFDAVRSECEAILFKDAELRGTIQAFRDSQKEASRQLIRESTASQQAAQEFYQDIEEELQFELAPISVRKMETQENYDLTQEQLYQLSLGLDKLLTRKHELEDDRGMETLSHEFKHLKKSDLLGQYDLFQSILKDDAVKEEFIRFLVQEAIPLTQDFVFESMLRFIRNDNQMPASTIKIEVIEEEEIAGVVESADADNEVAAPTTEHAEHAEHIKRLRGG